MSLRRLPWRRVVIGLVIIAALFGIYRLAQHHNKSTFDKNFSANLQTEGVNNINLLSKIIDGSGSKQTLDNSTKKIGDMITKAYGTKVGEEFLKGWNTYTKQSQAYASASKQSDEPAKSQALAAMETNAVTMSNNMAKLNPKLNAITLRSGLLAELLSTTQLSDDHLQANLVTADLQATTVTTKGLFGYIASGVTSQQKAQHAPTPPSYKYQTPKKH